MGLASLPVSVGDVGFGYTVTDTALAATASTALLDNPITSRRSLVGTSTLNFMCEGDAFGQTQCESMHCCTWDGATCTGDDTQCSAPAFVVSDGPCTVNGDFCLESPNFPSNHGSGHTCTVDVTYDGWLYVEAFDMGTSSDKLTVDGTQYSGTGDGLDGMTVSAATGAIQWESSSGSEGFKVCFDLAAPACDESTHCGPRMEFVIDEARFLLLDSRLRSFAEAEAVCVREGGHLATFVDTSEKDAVAVELQRLRVELGGGDFRFWLGYQGATTDGTWAAAVASVSADPGSIASFWEPNEPNNSGGANCTVLVPVDDRATAYNIPCNISSSVSSSDPIPRPFCKLTGLYAGQPLLCCLLCQRYLLSGSRAVSGRVCCATVLQGLVRVCVVQRWRNSASAAVRSSR